MRDRKFYIFLFFVGCVCLLDLMIFIFLVGVKVVYLSIRISFFG